MAATSNPRFTEFFKLNKSQWELDFVDIPLETDIELFVDPYAIKICRTNWCKECHQLLLNYFTLIIQSIKGGDDKTAKILLNNLHEPNDTRLGMSSNKPSGKGIGGVQGSQLFQSFKNSKAAKTGFLNDLEDTALFIDGIGRDKISDITTNIIRQKLIEYTGEQCKLYDIPVRKIEAGKYFDWEIMNWVNGYAELPVYKNTRILLVPKDAVRRSSDISPDKYYDFIIDYLKVEHTKPGDSLVHVLKSGELRVYKKELKVKYPFSRDFLYDFSVDHPDLYKKFKAKSLSPSTKIADAEIEARQSNPKSINLENRIQELKQIKTGSEDADKYHNLIIGILRLIYGDRIRRPKKEHAQNEGRKRIDITFENGRQGFFEDLYILHQIKCPYILFECKNYKNDLANPEYDQLIGRFNQKVGDFGILICRSIDNKKKSIQILRDIVNNTKGYVIVLTDDDIIELLGYRSTNNEIAIDDFMKDKLAEINF